MTLSFKDYAKKLEALGENVPAIFKQVAGRGAVHFRNEAVEETDNAQAVDTGAFKRNWEAVAVDFGNNEYGIVGYNGMEYASFLEDGYEIKEQHFVPFPDNEKAKKKKPKHTTLKVTDGKVISKAKPTGSKTKGGGIQNFMRDFRQKYPEAKGFMAKPRKFKGLKIGRKTMNDLEGWALLELRNEIDVAMTAQKYNISKKEARSYVNEANKPDKK